MVKIPRFAGDIEPNIDNYDAEYARIAKWLDQFLPKEETVTYSVKLTDSVKATYESVEVIKNLIKEGRKDYVIRRVAEKIIQYIPPKDYNREVKAVYNFVTRRLRYTKDINQVETVHRARDLLRWHRKAADCDDFVILTGALLEALGHPVRLVIIGNNYSNKDDFSHIYLQVSVKNKWISLDGSVPGAAVGWEAPAFAIKKVITLDGNILDLSGFADITTRNKLMFVILLAVIACYLIK